MISKFQVPQLFLGLFLRKLEIADYAKLAESLPWRLPEFDGQPGIAREVPKNADPNAARAIFQSADGRFALEVAPAKLQLRAMPGEVVDAGPNQKGLKPLGLQESFDTFIPLALKVHSVFSEHYGATANRIGIMTEMFAHLGASANQRMATSLLRGPHFGERLQELNIQALSKVTLYGDRQVNRWVRAKPLRSNDERRLDLAFGVEVDINTFAEDSYDLSTSDVEVFLKNVVTHIETGIPLLHEAAMFQE